MDQSAAYFMAWEISLPWMIHAALYWTCQRWFSGRLAQEGVSYTLLQVEAKQRSRYALLAAVKEGVDPIAGQASQTPADLARQAGHTMYVSG